MLGSQRNKADEDRFQIYTAILRIFNITKMAAERTERAVHNGRYWVFKSPTSFVIALLVATT